MLDFNRRPRILSDKYSLRQKVIGACEYAAKCAEPTNHNLYRGYGKFLAGVSDKGQVISDKSREEIREEARMYLEKAKEICEYRVAHGARRKELDEVIKLLHDLQSYT